MSQATEALAAFVPAGQSMRQNYSLDRITNFLSAIGEPQNQLRIVHIAGTSGKTSTAYFLRSLLQQAGTRTGLTISPHIISVSDRVQVDGKPLPDNVFVHELDTFLSMVTAHGVPLTYFEVLVAFAYWQFIRQSVDYAVVEVGLGGLLDGTNTSTRRDKVCVISDLGLDHTEVLGNTITEIAFQKAGIIHPGNHVLLQDQGQEAVIEVKRQAKDRGASLEIVHPGVTAVSSLPAFQQRNLALAAATYAYLAHRDGLTPVTREAQLTASRSTPPARMERFKVSDKTVILDGAHNPQKLDAVITSLQVEGVTAATVIANLVNAPPAKIDASLAEIRRLAAHLIVPSFDVAQDLGRNSVAVADLGDRARRVGITSVEGSNSLQRALEVALARPELVILITGSLYLASQIRPLLREREHA